ncbi:XrtA system polysaccharide chain length determinant, partial [Roseateles sp. GG27B]
LLQRYTEQHPDIVSVRKLIKDLEEQKRKEVLELRKAAMAAPAAGFGGAGGNGNLAQQEMSRMLAMTEVQV